MEDFDSHLKLMEGFHRRYLASNSVVRKYIEKVRRLEIERIAPQHGAIIYKKRTHS